MVGSIVGALVIGLINDGLIPLGPGFSQRHSARGGIVLLAAGRGK